MSVVNHVHLEGNVGADPRFVALKDGGEMSVVRLASNEWFRVNGQWRKSTEWHDLVVFGGLVESVRKHVRRGTELSLDGSLRRKRWTDREGRDRESVNVVVTGLRIGRQPRRDEESVDGSESDDAVGVVGTGDEVSPGVLDEVPAEELAKGAAPAGEAG